MANDAGCEICVCLIMLQYFFFKTFACEMVEFYGIIRWFGTKLCNAFPIVLLKYNCFIYIFFILVLEQFYSLTDGHPLF